MRVDVNGDGSTGVDSQTVKKPDFKSVKVDYTVQGKAITYPTDGGNN